MAQSQTLKRGRGLYAQPQATLTTPGSGWVTGSSGTTAYPVGAHGYNTFTVNTSDLPTYSNSYSLSDAMNSAE